ncbi:MAG: DNA-directed RNA polymerase subunit alpha [Candidatus Ancillula sp.]|jgi:DNA-directed RNA polymerase subunit alpha|nr:DNA-directed RNA polymerase subunit alpha [Candidatus Ancillula sp.]
MLITQRPTINKTQVSDTRYKFTIEPLQPGFGYTLGNSLRRALLSSIPGAAVSSIKIDGVDHEFAVKDGVKEDVVEIVLNIKNLVISSEVDDTVVAYIKKDKPGEITAADITVPAGVEVHNKDLHIATLSKGTFVAEMSIERGRGYVSADENKKLINRAEVGRIAIDSIYSPVLKVSYSVDATRVGEHTNFDKLTVDVTTKPSISPVDAVASAGATLVELFGLVNSLNMEAEGLEVAYQNDVFGDFLTSTAGTEAVSESIEVLNIGQRAKNILSRNEIATVDQLVSLTKRELLLLDSMGKTSVAEIEAALDEVGKALAPGK